MLLMLFCVQSAWAATCTAKATGNWGSAATWQGCGVPSAGDTVIIPSPYTVTVNTAATIDGVTINSGGRLIGSTSTAQTLTVNGNFINNGTATAYDAAWNISGSFTNSGSLNVGNHARVNVSGNFVNNGTYTFNGNDAYLRVGGNFTSNSNPDNGRVVLTGTAQTLNVPNNFRFIGLDVGTTTLTLTSNVVVNNDFYGTVNLASTCPTNYTLTYGSTVYNSCPCGGTSGTGLVGSYYNYSGGSPPSFPSGAPVLVRVDSQVDFNWGTASPEPGVVNANQFLVRWQGEVQATAAGDYDFRTVSDDGVRLWVNGTQVITNWNDHSSTQNTEYNVPLTACQRVPVIMEFYENSTDAEARLLWRPPGSSNFTAIPQARLYPSMPTVEAAQIADCNFRAITVQFSRAMQNDAGTNGILNIANYAVTSGGSAVTINSISSSDGITATLVLATALNPASNASVTVSNVKASNGIPMLVPSTQTINLNPGGFIGKYYTWTGTTPATDNPTGTPGLTRFDATINFDWSNNNGPWGTSGVTDKFQARWSGTVTIPTTGFYTFYASSDDGQRLWLNGAQMLDDWVLHSVTERTIAAQSYTAGQQVKIDYAMYENAGYAVAKLYWQAGTTSGGSNIFSKRPVSGAYACPLPVTAPANFNAFETDTAANSTTGVIKTKIAGQPFNLAVVALTDAVPATLKTDFEGTVSLELVNGSGTTACASRTQIAAAGSVAFVTANAGRVNASFTESNAWPDVLVRMTYTPASGSPVVACSSDHFAIRPNVLAVSVTDNDWETAGTTRTLNNISATGGTVHKAGRPFTITATAYNAAGTPAITTNYAGAPTAVTTAYVLPTACTGCALNGVVFTGGGGTVITSTASYNEVGAFKMQLQDAQFANIDAADSSEAERTITSTEINVGRFVPDHFTLKTGSAVTPACGGAAGFTYMDQAGIAVSYGIEAQNYAGNKTANYSTTATNNLAPGVVNVVAENGDAGANLAGRMTLPTATWLSGTYEVDAMDVTFRRRTLALDGTVDPDGPYDSLQLGVNVTDADGVRLQGLDMNAGTKDACGSACDSKAIGNPTKVRFGRLRLMNAYGAGNLSLPIPMIAQYYNSDIGGFVTNTLDNCTRIETANIGFYNLNGTVTTGTATVGDTFASGVGRLRIAPGTDVRVCVDLGADALNNCTAAPATSNAGAWLQGKWGAASTEYKDDPSARASFGIHKKANEFIYIREMY